MQPGAFYTSVVLFGCSNGNCQHRRVLFDDTLGEDTIGEHTQSCSPGHVPASSRVWLGTWLNGFFLARDTVLPVYHSYFF